MQGNAATEWTANESIASIEEAVSEETACAAVAERLAVDPELEPAVWLTRQGSLEEPSSEGGALAAAAAEAFVAAEPVLRNEGDGAACAPVFCGGQVIGVVCVQSDAALGDGVLCRVEQSATALGARIERLRRRR